MKRFILFITFIFILYHSWPSIEKQIGKTDFASIYETVEGGISHITESPNFETAVDSITSMMGGIIGKLDQTIEKQIPKEDQPVKLVKKPDLDAPSEHVFSVHNIELGKSKTEVEKQVGAAKRVSANEYGTNWYSYHKSYQNFLMISYDENNQVDGLYTDQDLISSTKGIKLGTAKDAVRKQLGTPVTKILKGLTYYQVAEDRDYDMYHLDNSYVTIFYDKHEDNTVTAIQIIRDDLEKEKKGFYGEESEKLKEGFEYQLFDLTNAARVEHGLSALTWDDHIKETARGHSKDMAVNNYFNHTNLKGESPFDRMQDDHIRFSVAGENLAYGQFSSIFAHEGLMNSLGHRKNILNGDFVNLGVGVAFNSQSIPYYTENFYTK